MDGPPDPARRLARDPEPTVMPATPRPAVQRWRLVIRREAGAPDLPQRAVLDAWDRALRSSGLPCAGLDGDPPRPRFTVAAPLAAGVPAEAELLDVPLLERLPVWRVRQALAGVMPEGHSLVDVHDVWLGEPPLSGQVVASIYRVTLASATLGAGDLRAASAAMLAADALPRLRRKGDVDVPYDVRPFLEAIDVEDGRDGPILRLRLRHDPERGIGRPDETLAELGARTGSPLPIASLVRERLVLRERPAGREPAPAAAPVPSTGPRGRAPRAGR